MAHIRPALILGLGLLGVLLAAVALGSGEIGAVRAWRALVGLGDPDASLAVWVYRLPRIALAGVVGASLSLAGAALQGLFQNDLADPYVLGVSAGGALGAALALALGLGTLLAPPLFALLGAALALMLVYRLGRTAYGLSLPAVLLGGVAIGLTCSAGITLVLLLADERRTDVLLWLMGYLGGAQWTQAGIVCGALLLSAVMLRRHATGLDLMLGGELSAAALGVDVARLKRDVLIAAAVLVAGAVAFCGLIGFVGLIVPHVLRFWRGPSHRTLLWQSMVLGAAVLIGADAAVRALGEWPVGVLTGAIGGPFFLILLRRQTVDAARG
jgi:iron complex transport system permease protein